MPLREEIYESGVRIGLWETTESEAALRVGITLSPASMARINACGSGKRRRELLAVRSLMHRMGLSDNDLHYQGDRPVLHSGRHVSISHSGTMVCVALSLDEPVGVDIQEIKPRLSSVMKWLSRPLRGSRQGEEAGDTPVHAGLQWTAREAMYKIGGGADFFLRDFETSVPGGELPSEGHFTGRRIPPSPPADYHIAYWIRGGYVLALARPSGEKNE